MEEARRRAGGGSALAAALKDAGVSPDSGAYSESAVSNWIKGRTRPHADVLLAACSLYGLSLDAQIPGKLTTSVVSESKELDLAKMRSDLDKVMQQLAAGPQLVSTTQDVVAAYSNRNQAFAGTSLTQLIAPAQFADYGISLNMVCQDISDTLLAELVERGLTVRALFLDPEGHAIQLREADEGLTPGTLQNLTRNNLAMLGRIHDRLTPAAQPRLQIRLYDQLPDANLTIIDATRAYAQFYLSQTRGNASPTFICENQDSYPQGLFPLIEAKFEDAWKAAR